MYLVNSRVYLFLFMVSVVVLLFSIFVLLFAIIEFEDEHSLLSTRDLLMWVVVAILAIILHRVWLACLLLNVMSVVGSLWTYKKQTTANPYDQTN